MQHILPDTYNFYNLYNDIMALCDGGDTFFFADRVLDNVTYRIFNYRLASYTHFCKKNALEARGIMFALTDENGVVLEDPKLVCRPIPKFFNLNENPKVMGLTVNADTIKRMEVKEDGSLISTFIHKGELRVKSKGSIESEQAVDAMKWIEKNPTLKQELFNITKQNFTVDMEWVAPFNRIVLNYREPNLVILHIRCNTTGTLMTRQSVDQFMYPNIHFKWVQDGAQQLSLTYAQILEEFDDLTGIEGFVVYLNDGTIFKMKTPWYIKLHLCKSDVNIPRRLFECIVYESVDDLITLFTDDVDLINQITKEQVRVGQIYNHLVSTVERFHNENKHLDRKQYAILGQKTLTQQQFGLAMLAYTGKDIDYKAFMIKNYETFQSDESANQSDI